MADRAGEPDTGDEFAFQQRRTELSRNPAWQAVFIIFDRLGRDGRIWKHVDLQTETIVFKDMLETGTFSGGERRLIEIAASLFNDEHKVNLWEALSGLDDKSAAAVEEAIAAYLHPSPPWHALRPKEQEPRP